ncbi:MAG: HAD family phosphatase [Fimbriimonadaceae bacterium]|nr:HAD family phosphatase [Fimbriimonadaceae bacterium]
MIKAVLFDADGVLVDACELHYVALNRALAEHGYEITREEHIRAYNGLPTRVKLGKLTDEKGFPKNLHETVHEQKQQLTVELIEEVLRPDMTKVQLVKELLGHEFLVAVCSNSLRQTLDRMLRAIGLLDYVNIIVGNDDVKKAKPAPDIYLEGARRLGISIKECLIVEDSPVGLLAAHAANPAKIVKVSSPDEVNVGLLPKLIGPLDSKERAKAA